LEEQIDAIQDALDAFNSVTKINVKIPDVMSRVSR